ncbi:TPA_asm: hypothetical protein [Triaenorhabdovirus 2]|nr:TPA_asm: hypothetical protein [Triaenorhabdovirus 2]
MTFFKNQTYSGASIEIDSSLVVGIPEIVTVFRPIKIKVDICEGASFAEALQLWVTTPTLAHAKSAILKYLTSHYKAPEEGLEFGTILIANGNSSITVSEYILDVEYGDEKRDKCPLPDNWIYLMLCLTAGYRPSFYTGNAVQAKPAYWTHIKDFMQTGGINIVINSIAWEAWAKDEEFGVLCGLMDYVIFRSMDKNPKLTIMRFSSLSSQYLYEAVHAKFVSLLSKASKDQVSLLSVGLVRRELVEEFITYQRLICNEIKSSSTVPYSSSIFLVRKNTLSATNLPRFHTYLSVLSAGLVTPKLWNTRSIMSDRSSLMVGIFTLISIAGSSECDIYISSSFSIETERSDNFSYRQKTILLRSLESHYFLPEESTWIHSVVGTPYEGTLGRIALEVAVGDVDFQFRVSYLMAFRHLTVEQCRVIAKSGTFNEFRGDMKGIPTQDLIAFIIVFCFYRDKWVKDMITTELDALIKANYGEKFNNDHTLYYMSGALPS